MDNDEIAWRWDLPPSHPESWVQRNGTYRDIWRRTIEECAQVAEKYGRYGYGLVIAKYIREQANEHKEPGDI